MTDLLLKHNILNEMSSAFNNQAIPANEKLPSVSEDSTLKWRGLLNNTYASKEKEAAAAISGRKRSGEDFKEAIAEAVEEKMEAPDYSEAATDSLSKNSSMVTDTLLGVTSSDTDNATKPAVDKRANKARGKPLLDKSDRSLRSNRNGTGKFLGPY